MTTIHALPAELLIEIWNHIRDSQLDTQVLGRCMPEGIPITLVASAVSIRWRTIAINASSLWTDIYIHTNQSAESVKMHLKRSNISSLNVIAHFIENDETTPDDLAQPQKITEIMRILSPHVYRFRVFSLTLEGFDDSATDKCINEVLAPLYCTPAPRLIELEMSWWLSTNLPPLFADTAPNLSRVDFRGMSIEQNLTLLTGLSSLTLLELPDIGRPTHAQFRELLLSSPSLTSLSLDSTCVQYGSMEPSQYSTIHVPSLRDLTLTFPVVSVLVHESETGPEEVEDDEYMDDVIFITLFFTLFSAPGLHSLTLEEMRGATMDAFISAMHVCPACATPPKYPVLSKLYIGDKVIDKLHREGRVIDITPCFPSIDYLELDEGSGEFRALLTFVTTQDMVRNSAVDALWPRLRTLVWPHVKPSDEHVLAHFISGRDLLGIPIESLSIEECRFSELRDEFQKWLHDNVSLTILPC